MSFRCQKRDATDRQCVLAAEHVGKVRCRFGATTGTAEAQPTAVTEDRRRKMNKTEGRYAMLLEGRRLAGELKSFEYEAVTLRLAHDCRYTGDFFVVTASDGLEIHEIKGAHIWEDSKIKLKVAASEFPCFKFYLAKWEKGEWTVAEVRI